MKKTQKEEENKQQNLTFQPCTKHISLLISTLLLQHQMPRGLVFMRRCSVIIIQLVPQHTYHTYALTTETRLLTLIPQIILSFFVCVCNYQ